MASHYYRKMAPHTCSVLLSCVAPPLGLLQAGYMTLVCVCVCVCVQEYERRLLYKDQEIQGVRDKLASAQRDMEGMNHSLQHLRRELDSARQQAAVDALAGAQQQIEQYEAQVSVA